MDIRVERSYLIRNTALNFLGQFIPLIVGVLCVPVIANSLGPERFGVLSLAWLVIASLSVFDLGMGRAMVKFVAETLGKGELTSLPPLVWSIILLQVVLGIIAGASGLIVLHLFGGRILQLSPDVVWEAIATFKILMVGLPIVLVATSLGGVLEATQRFDITNAIRTASISASFLLPIIGISLGLNLAGIVLLLVCAKILALAALFVAVFSTIPVLRNIRTDLGVLRRVLGFGTWITLSNGISPVLVNLDRYVLAILLPITAVGYYTPASQAISYLSIVPASVTSTLFPAYSMLSGMGQYERINALFARSVKYTLLVLSPLVVILACFSSELLTVWIGQEYATQSTLALKILAIGVLINALAFSPSTLLQALGRPDIPAKFHLLELPIHAGLTWIFIQYWGITGAALAWSIRVSLDAIMLFAASFCVLRNLPRYLSAHQLVLCAILAVALVAASLNVDALAAAAPIFIRIILLCTMIAVFLLTVWVMAIDNTDREIMRSLCRTLRGQSRVDKPSAI
jgi:O-antigen/teichoic acid export membrane protein